MLSKTLDEENKAGIVPLDIYHKNMTQMQQQFNAILGRIGQPTGPDYQGDGPRYKNRNVPLKEKFQT